MAMSVLCGCASRTMRERVPIAPGPTSSQRCRPLLVGTAVGGCCVGAGGTKEGLCLAPAAKREDGARADGEEQASSRRGRLLRDDGPGASGASSAAGLLLLGLGPGAAATIPLLLRVVRRWPSTPFGGGGDSKGLAPRVEGRGDRLAGCEAEEEEEAVTAAMARRK